MSITTEAALTQLANLQQLGPVSLSQLQNLVSQISVDTPGAASGATKIFYSGNIGNAPVNQAVTDIVNASGGSTEMLGEDTAVSEFFETDQFKNALQTAVASYNATNPSATITVDQAMKGIEPGAGGGMRKGSP